MAWRSGHKDVLPFFALVATEFTNVGSHIFFKVATSRGLSYYVFIVYSYAIVTIILLPLAFIFRRTELLRLNVSLLVKVFLLGLIGFSGNICVYRGIKYGSPTLASAIGNLSPAFVFMLVVIFRMERVALRSSSSQAKALGTLVSISGALIVVLYKGPTILSTASDKDWAKGGILLSFGYLLYCTCSILQLEMAWSSGHKDFLPFIALVAIEFTSVGSHILFKAATSRGLSYCVFTVYTYAIATIILLPLTFIFRRTDLPPLNVSLLVKVFLLGLIGFSGNICVYRGIKYSSPTLASAIGNLSPAFIFILAVIFRMERVTMRSSSTQAKVLGTLVSISGALIVVLYKGPTILSTASDKDWVKGGILLSFGYLLYCTCSILQTHIMSTYPDELFLAFSYNLCGTIISAPACFMAETNLGSWLLRPGIPLLATLYSGSFASILHILVHSWALHSKGPVYVANFKPLSIAIAAISGVIFLGDDLYLGSVVGAIILSIGFYAVIWGKANEKMSPDCGFDSLRRLPIGKTPLLES